MCLLLQNHLTFTKTTLNVIKTTLNFTKATLNLTKLYGGRPVSDGWFRSLSFQSGDVFVKVRQSARHGLGHMTQLGPADHVSL